MSSKDANIWIHVEIIRDEQFGFMPGRGTTDAIFAVEKLTDDMSETDSSGK